MLRKKVFETIDVLRNDLDKILQENLVLKSNLKEAEEKYNKLHAEYKKGQSYIMELTALMKNMQRLPNIDGKVKDICMTKIKMGSDWWLEGEDFIDVKLFKKYSFVDPITYCELSNDSKFIGIVSGRCCYFLDVYKNELYLLNHINQMIEPVHFSNMKRMPNTDDRKMGMMFSNESKTLYCAYGNKTVLKWDIIGKKYLRMWACENEVVLMMMKMSKGYVAKKDNKLRIYESTVEKETIIDLNSNSVPTSMAITNDNKYVFIGLSDRKLVIFNTENQERYEIEVMNGLRKIDLSSCNKYLLVIGNDDTINVYSIDYEKIELEQIHGPIKTGERVIGCSFFASSRYVITSSVDLCAKILDLKTQKSLVINGHYDNITSLSIKKNYFCTASNDGRLKLWNYEFN